MKRFTDAEVRKDWDGLQRRHRSEIAEAVANYCVGRGVQETGRLLDRTPSWVREQLDRHAVLTVGTGGGRPAPPTSEDVTRDDLRKVIKRYSPKVAITDEGITGPDAAEFEPYFDHYREQGHEPATAARLAKGEWAGEAAVEAGVIKEGVNKRNEKVKQILFPDAAKTAFDMDLKRHILNVKLAAAFLDKAKIRNLRRQSTCEMVAEADALWRAQAELVLQHYEPSMEN